MATPDMRFGFFIPQGWRRDMIGIDPAEQWDVNQGLARRADSGPWDSVWVYDHVHTTPIATDEPTHEEWTLMAALAASTSRVRLGQMCTCVIFRNPAHLAKVAATVDHVSRGRVEMGIGAGWYEEEAEVADRRAWLREHWSAKLSGGLIDDELASFDNRPAAVGTVEQVVEKFTKLRALGMTYPIFFVPDAAYSTRSLELLEQVIAELRRG